MQKLQHKYNFIPLAIFRQSTVFTVFLLTFILLVTSPLMATSEVQSVPESQQAKDLFSYELESRKDPFVPFLSPKATSSSIDMNEIVDASTDLTGMQLFEPGQLNLVALLARDNVYYAMVEDVTGKGYILSQGTKIGRRGVVKNIIANKVLIEETAFTRAGKKIVTQVVMVLKKEGEE